MKLIALHRFRSSRPKEAQANSSEKSRSLLTSAATAFTLIEVMISSALMALILVSAYLCLGAGFSAQKMVEPRAEIIQNARVALALISADLRAACPLSQDNDFLGMSRTLGDIRADNVDFATHNFTPRHPREGDFCQESFYVDQDRETGQFSLFRRRNPTIGLDDLSGGSKEEIAKGVVGFRLEYFDGDDWYDSWGQVKETGKQRTPSRSENNLSGLPEAVRITLLMDSNPKKKDPDVAVSEEKMEPPFVFQTVVRLNLAGTTQNSSATSGEILRPARRHKMAGTIFDMNFGIMPTVRGTGVCAVSDVSAPARPLLFETHRTRRASAVLQRASILVGLLWCLAILSVVVIGVLHTARMDLLVQKNYGDKIQARYLALAGIEKARALIYRDAHDRSRTRKNHTGDLYDDEQDFKNVAFGRGTFSLLRRGRSDEGGGIIYGISDEESRLNVNTADSNELSQLEYMTPDAASAIINWRGGDNTTTAGEVQYYTGLTPPYQPRLGAFQTVRELLMVRGVSPDLLLGRDIHQNGLLTMGEKDFAFPGSVDAEDLGWAGILTVDSSVPNLDAAGDNRVNIQTADESSLTAISGIKPQIARAIVSYRGQHRFQSIADLLDVTPPQNQGASVAGDNSDQSGNRVVDENLFMDIADEVTTDDNQTLSGAINVNTASLDVLICLPNVSRELAQAIISQRQSAGYFANIGELLKVPGMTRDIFKGIAPLVTARSETFRLLAEGKINSSGARQRIQVIVHAALNDQKILSWREDDL